MGRTVARSFRQVAAWLRGRAPARETLVDLALGAAVALVVAVAIAADLGGDRRPDLLAYLFALGLGLLMLVRRHAPLLTLAATTVGLLAYYAADYPPVGLALPVSAALYSAAEHGRLRTAVATAGALLAVSSFFRIREGEDLAYLLGYELASTVAIMAAAIALGEGVRSRRRWRVEQRRREELVAADKEREAAGRVAEERLRIARDVHDVLGHTVTVVSLQADVATEALDDGDPAAARAALATIRTASGGANRELRATLALLRRPAEQAARAPTGTLQHLDHLMQTMAGSGLPVTLRVEGPPAPLPAVVDTTAYRIIQESLTNALRHAGASHVELVLRYSGEQLQIRVTDDGCGVTGDGWGGTGGGHGSSGGGHGGTVADGGGTAASAGGGLPGMRERAALLGGSVHAGGRAGYGFQVDAMLPLAVTS